VESKSVLIFSQDVNFAKLQQYITT